MLSHAMPLSAISAVLIPREDAVTAATWEARSSPITISPVHWKKYFLVND